VARGTNDALTALERQGIPLARTWRHGSVGLRWSADGIKTRGFLEEIDRQTEREEHTESSAMERPAATITDRAPDGVQLAGRWIPASDSSADRRTALLLHGFAESSWAFGQGRADILNRRGWNVAVLDARGYGASDGPYGSCGARFDVAQFLTDFTPQPGTPWENCYG
jgi:pimeloyl-ACP methyl ester carboxylesterase